MPRLILVNRYFHPDESATSQMLTDLAQHLAARHEVVVLTSRQKLEDPLARLPAEDTAHGVRVHRLWSTTLGRDGLPGRLLDYLSFMAAVALWLLLHVRRGDRVLAKTDPPLLGVLTTLATLGRGVQRIQWLQDLYPEAATGLGVVADAGPISRIVRGLRDWSLRQSDLIVAISPGMLEYLRGRTGHAALAHIPNWAEDFGPETQPRAAGRFTVGYCGNLGRAHPIEGLLQLAEGAPDPQIRFLFSGGGAHHERLRARVEALGRENWSFLPYQPRAHLAALLRRADLHLVILDPRTERFIFPSKVYGILSAGRPILHLGDPAGEVARLLSEHGCGWTVPAHDGAGILRLLQTLRAAPEQLAGAGRAARRAYERSYSRAGALEDWDEVLGRV